MPIVRVRGIKRDSADDLNPLIKSIGFDKLYQNPIMTLSKFFKGTQDEYMELLNKNNVGYDEFNRICESKTLFTAEFNNYFERLFTVLQSSQKLPVELEKYSVNRIRQNNTLLEHFELDLSDFTKEQYDEISQAFVVNFQIPAVLAFVDYDDDNRKLQIYSSIRLLHIRDNTLIVTAPSKDPSTVKTSLNINIQKIKDVNYNVVEATKSICETIESLYPEMKIAVKTNGDNTRFYVKSDLYDNEERTEKEKFFLEELEQVDRTIRQEEPRGSLSPNSTKEVIEELQKEKMPTEETEEITEAKEKIVEELMEDTEELVEVADIDLVKVNQQLNNRINRIEELEEAYKTNENKNTSVYYEKLREQIAYAESVKDLAKEVFEEAIANGTPLDKAFDIVNQRVKGNPYVVPALKEHLRNRLLGYKSKEQVVSLMKDVVDLEKNKSKAKDIALAKQDKEIEELNQKYSKLEKQYNSDLDKFKAELEKLVNENEELNQIATLSEATIKEQDIKISSLNSDNSKLTLENTTIKASLEVAQKQIATLNSDLDKVKSESMAKISSLEKELEEAKSKLSKANNANETLSNQMSIIQDKMKSKEELLQTSYSQNDLLSKSNDELKTMLENAKVRYSELEAEKESLVKQLEDSKTLIAEAKKVQSKSKENENISKAIKRNEKIAKYTLPVEKSEIKSKLEKAKDGSLETARLSLLLKGKVDLLTMMSRPDLSKEASEQLKANEKDFNELVKIGVLKEEKGVYSIKDDTSKKILFDNSDKEVSEIKDEVDDVKYYESSDKNPTKRKGYRK
jgi:chromosome segregation ATPase